jgi:RND family efflux transporter MFP subunit
MDSATSFATMAAAQTRPRLRSLKTAVRWLIILAVMAALGAGAWWFVTGPVSVTGIRVTRGSVADVVYATGFVEPRRPVEVSSRVTAPVISVLADEGTHVARGQALANLDAEDQRETIAQLTANRVNAEQDERRALALFQQGWSTNEARDKAVASANAARALEAAGRARLNQYTIRSGISGIVLRRDVEPGDLATASKILFEIGDPHDLRVTATVDERDIPLVRTGTVAMMSTEAYPGRILRGTVYEITPGGDPDQRAFRVRIRPDNTSRLPVGLTLEVNIIVSQRQHAMLVPANSIHDDAVWIVEGGRARRAQVEIGIRGTDRTEITRGLSDRACVITDPAPNLKDGERVSAKGC